jgi:hypothetical protein
MLNLTSLDSDFVKLVKYYFEIRTVSVINIWELQYIRSILRS